MGDKYHVGQTVILKSDRRPVQQVEVIRVGRTLVYVMQYGRERSFRIADGRDSKHGSNSGGVPDYIVTENEYFEDQRRQGAVLRLQELGITNTGYGQFKYDTDVLLEIVALLEREERK